MGPIDFADHITVIFSAQAAEMLKEIGQRSGYMNDAEALDACLGGELAMQEARAEGWTVMLKRRNRYAAAIFPAPPAQGARLALAGDSPEAGELAAPLDATALDTLREIKRLGDFGTAEEALAASVSNGHFIERRLAEGCRFRLKKGRESFDLFTP